MAYIALPVAFVDVELFFPGGFCCTIDYYWTVELTILYL